MNSTKKLAIVLLMLLCVTCVFTACDLIPMPATYTITSEKDSYEVTIGDTVDYKSYFTITDANGIKVEVTDAMISAPPNADLTKEGQFIVTCNYKGATKQITIQVCQPIVPPSIEYTITSEKDSYTVKVGDTVDFTTYFTITDSIDNIPVTNSMIDSSSADLSKAGSFTVTCSYEGASKTITFVVEENNQGGGDQQTADLSDVFAKYDDYEKWNFKLKFTVDAEDEDVASEYAYTLIYAYDGYDFYYTDLDDLFVDYVIYTDEDILYYLDNNDGTYSIFSYVEEDEEFDEYYNDLDFVELTKLSNYEFVKNGDHYSAKVPSEAGNTILGEYESCTYLTFDLYVIDGKIAKIIATQQDDDLNTVFTYTAELSAYDTVTIDVSDLVIDDSTGGNTGGDSTGGETQEDIVVTFQDSTDSTTLNSTGDVKFTASRAADGWDSYRERGIFFNKTKGNVTLTSTTTVNNVASITVVVAENKGIDATIKVKVGNTVFTYNGNNQVTFKGDTTSFEKFSFTFVSSTAVSGTVTIEIVPSKTNENKLGSVYIQSITLSAAGTSGSGSGGGSTQKETMPSQSYDASKHEDYDDILSDAIIDYNERVYQEATLDGLSSQGNYNVLVIPVEFSNDKFTDIELTDIVNVFNNKANTGWESVSSYYNTSSYGKLNMTFDVTGKITLPNNYSYYEKQQSDGGNIVSLALDMLDARGFDFSKYDYNNDGYIDGVYIIHSAPINSNYYWAYVYAIENETKYDDLYAYKYLFASVDFMYDNNYTNFVNDEMKLDATTYIHETGHMLGLDDYYDYESSMGSNQGLGGADMMDYTVGDHNAYSKLMLGWVKPTVVTTTTTTPITIKPFESSGQFIMVLLNYNGTYFSEYLIIDLYTATGLNELHAGVKDSLLYYDSTTEKGADYGVRIYHVDSTIDNPYSENEYGSFTDNNNSVTKDPLIKLVEADGDKNFESDIYNGSAYASENDLWQTGDVFSAIQPNYTRHDGKLINFDISFDSVTATEAKITITFNTAE